MRQHHPVWRRKVRALLETCVGRAESSSQDRNAFSCALAVMSGRAWVLEAPQVVQRQRVRPAEVVPFLTSLDSHTPQVGELRAPDTEHAFKACSDPHQPRSTPRNPRIYTHILAVNPRVQRILARDQCAQVPRAFDSAEARLRSWLTDADPKDGCA